MNKPVLPPACYTQQDWYDLEQKKIFGELWLFVGLTTQLLENDSFITRDFSGVPVLVQNINGELYAFRNACAHRGMPIQTEESGVRKLICPYHSWGYKADGTLAGIPNAKIYNMCDADRASIKLQSFKLEVVGNFIFVNLSATPMPITDQYSADMLKMLTVISESFAPYFSYSHFTTDYNWKLNFENVIDWNHVQFVHHQSFAWMIPNRFGPVESNRSVLFAEGGPLADLKFSPPSALSGDVDLRDISHLGRSPFTNPNRWFAKHLDTPSDLDALLTGMFYPNLNVGCLWGEQYYIQQFVPTSTGHTEYHSWMFTSRLKPELPPMPHILWGLHQGEKRVLEEDIVLLNALQKNLESAETIGLMGDHESKLNAIGRWYMKQLKGEAA